MTQPLLRPADQDVVALFAKYNNTPLIVGSQYPDAILARRVLNQESKEVLENFSTHTEFRGRKVIVFFVPGAYTPTCTKDHLGGFKEIADTLYQLGIEGIYCATPDKVDVAHNWNKAHGNTTAIKMLAYDRASDVFALGLACDMSGNRAQALGMKRTAMIINDLNVEWIQTEESNASCGITHATAIENYLRTNNAADRADRKN